MILEQMNYERTWQTKSNVTDGFCQTALKYTIFDAEKYAKKIFGKIDFKCVLLDFYKSRVSESIGNFSQKLIYGLKLVQAVFKSPLKNSSRLVRTRPSNPEPKSH